MGVARAIRSIALLGVAGLCIAVGEVALAEETSPSGEGTYGPTTREDTLWSVANRVRPPGATVADTIEALQRMNPCAFVNGDPDQLVLGVVLEIPTTAVMVASSIEESPAPPPEEVNTSAATDAAERQRLAMKNAELEERLQALGTELEAATATVGALEGRVSALRGELADSRAAARQSPITKIVEAIRGNVVAVIGFALLLVAASMFLYARGRSRRQVPEPAPPAREAPRTGPGQPDPEAAPAAEVDPAHDAYAPATKLNLARAFIGMGRTGQAREVLEEVLVEGNEDERREADELLRQME